MTPAPVVAARAKQASGVGVKTMPVKMETHLGVMPPPCSSFTPVKSPEQKRPKASAPKSAPVMASAAPATTAFGGDGHGVDVPMDGAQHAGKHPAEAEKDVL